MTAPASWSVEGTPVLDALYGRMTREGRCSGQTSGEAADAWFPVSSQGGSDVARLALEVQAREECAGCPVASECRTWAVATRQGYGVWGGMTEGELRLAVRVDVRAARLARRAVVEVVGDEAAAVEPVSLRLAEVVRAGRDAPMRQVYAAPAVAEVA